MVNSKIYRLYGINVAIELLRPNAKWEISNRTFTRWEDERPCPTWAEIDETMEKIRQFEDSINTVWLEEDWKRFTGQIKDLERLKV